MNATRFGKHPAGSRLTKTKESPNYKNGEFQNLSDTPMITEDASYWSMLKEFILSKVKEPENVLPSKKTNLMDLNPEENVVIWMGHSSYFIQLDGKKMLVDPVMSGYASPVSFTTKAYKGSDVYITDDIPDIDYLFITHDHWDHMDYNTLMKLKSKIRTIITGLGNGAHLESWGFNKEMIIEEDWNTELQLDDGFTAHVLPARHFSGRGLKRNQTLWASFAVVSPSSRIYIGGDGGYDSHFSQIGEKFGPFDLAVLENGQYDKNWKYIHLLPEEVLKAAIDLNAKALLPVHSGKFTLANHHWDTPLSTITKLVEDSDMRVLTPMIGEPINLKDPAQLFTKWWELVKK